MSVSGSSPLSRGIPNRLHIADVPKGSSPLSRGIHDGVDIVEYFRRIIPALAGNTPSSRVCGEKRSDHPRSRGEYRSNSKFATARVGSSPLSRGIRMVNSQEEVRERIIPALAGNTTSGSVTLAALPDHPRSRGEYQIQAENRRLLHGSSPLSRGIRDERFQCHQHSGIIPALAGNTAAAGWRGSHGWDHPRSRGEYMRSCCIGVRDVGSSPLSRGIRTVNSHEPPRRGIIPALAGNTAPGRGITLERTDHPRSRGEYLSHGREILRNRGSSPLSRGIPTA